MTIFRVNNNIFEVSGVRFSVADGVPELLWDANASTAGQTDGGGAWLNANQWWTGSVNQTWVSKYKAIFGNGGTGGNVTLASPTTVHYLTFKPHGGSYTIGTAGQLLTIRYGIDKRAGSGGLTFGSPILLEADQIWHNNSTATLAVNSTITNGGKTLTILTNTGLVEIRALTSIISGSGGLIKKGAGRLNLGTNQDTPHSYSGATVIEGGNLMISHFSANWLPYSNIIVRGGILEIYWTATLIKTLGSGADQIQILEGSSGFSQNGSGQTATFIFNNDANYEMVWGSAYFKPTALVLSSDINPNNGPIVQINNKIDLNGTTRTIYVGRNPALTSPVGILQGVIRDSVGGAGLLKIGKGQLWLKENNTFTGNFEWREGSVKVDSATNTNCFGANNQINVTGDFEVYNFNNSFTIPRPVSISLDKILTFSGAAGETTILAGVVSGAGGIATLNLSNGFVVRLQNFGNTFTGPIKMIYGQFTTTLDIYSLADTTSEIDIGNGNAAYALNFVLSAPMTLVNRPIRLTGTTGTVSINSSGLAPVTIASPISILTAGNKTLKLGGTSTATDVINTSLADSSGYSITLAKDSAGVWCLGGTNTYSGITDLLASGTTGVLVFRGSQSLSPNTTIVMAQASSNVQSLRFLDDGVGTNLFVRPIQFGGSNTTQGMNIFVGNNNMANFGSSAGATVGSTNKVGTITFTSIAVDTASTSVNVTGANGYRLETGIITLNNLTTRTAGQTTATILNSTTANMTVEAITMATGNTGIGNDGVPVLRLSGTSTDNRVVGEISNASDYLTGQALSVEKISNSTWTLSGVNTYTGATTITTGRLTFSGASSLPASSAVSVGANGKLCFVDNTARNTSISSLTLSSGASLCFDWTGNNTGDQITCTGDIATSVGNYFVVILNRVGTPSGSVTLLTGGAGSSLANAEYYLSGMTDFTATLTKTATTVAVGSYASQTPLTAFYWQGDKLSNTISGVRNSLDLSDGAVSNWSSTNPAYTGTALIPGATADIIFANNQTGKTQQTCVFSSDLTIKSLTIDDSVAVSISGPNGSELTLLSTASTAGTVALPGSAISVTSTSSNSPSINNGIVLGSDQTWHVASGKTLTISGAIRGNYGLTKASSGILKMNELPEYFGGTVVSAGEITLSTAWTSATAFHNSAGIVLHQGAKVKIHPTPSNSTYLISSPITLGGGTGTSIIQVGSNSTKLFINSTIAGEAGVNQVISIVQGVSTTGEGQIISLTNTVADGAGGSLGVSVDFSGSSTVNQNAFVSLTGNNTFTGDLTITNSRGLQSGSVNLGGWVTIGGRTQSGSPTTVATGYLGGGNYAGNISISSGTGITTLCFASIDNQILSGVISGSGRLSMNGPSVLTLTATNTYTGTTTVNGLYGILRIKGTTTSNTTITVGTLEGNNDTGGVCTISGTVTVADSVSSILRPGTFGNNIMNTGALTFGGTSARLIIDSTASTMSKVAVTGDVALGACVVIFNAGITTNGTYKIITATGTMSGTLPNILTNSTGKTIVLQQTGNDLEAVVS